MRTPNSSPSPLILAGPTTAGKSAVAEAISDMTGGTIITADRGYMYAMPGYFELGLGLTPGELEDGRPRRLFGSLDPHDEPLSPAEYMDRLRAEVNTIQEVGGLAIVEGCTRRYNTALIDEYGLDRTAGVFWPSEDFLHDKLTTRVQKAVQAGMYEEIEGALDAGYANAHPMTTVPYLRSIDVITGREQRPDAEAAMANELAEISVEHQESYLAIEGLRPFVHEGNNTRAVASDILAEYDIDS